MNLRDAESGKVLWQGTEDLSVPGVEHEGMFSCRSEQTVAVKASVLGEIMSTVTRIVASFEQSFQ